MSLSLSSLLLASRRAVRVVGSNTLRDCRRRLATASSSAASDIEFGIKHLAPTVVARPPILWTHGKGKRLDARTQCNIQQSAQ
jgi:hypothetical protein